MPVVPDTPLPPSEDTPLNAAVIGVLILVAVGGIIDLIMDQPESWWSAHVILELLLTSVSITLAIVLWRRWRRATGELRVARETVQLRQAERDAWRASSEEALRSFGEAIALQMTRWALTPSEREVALLLLQGLGHKQIAARTGRGERTVRQHAVSVYSKSGQRGRAELAAFFLTGITLPDEQDSAH